MSVEQRKLDVVEREQAIFKVLRGIDPAVGATVRELHEHLTVRGTDLATTGPVRDTVTVQAYHKLIARLVLDGRLVEVDPPAADAQRYALAPAVHADTAMSLDDIEQLLAGLRPTEAIAALIEARESMRGDRRDILRKAAVALQKVDPRDLIRDVIARKAELYNADLAAWRAHGGDDERHLQRLKADRGELERLCYRGLGLSHQAVYVPPASAAPDGDRSEMRVTLSRLEAELRRRVFGDTVIQCLRADNAAAPKDWSNVVVAGSDGSTYSSVMSIDTARAFVDDGGSEVVTFNNSIVFLRMEGLNRDRHRSPLYSVPITRSAIDSPDNAGMVMAPFMYRDLDESEYEHMAKCATDVVQWRADERVFTGVAPALGSGGTGQLLPPPRVHLRDGTVTLQERESHHYMRNDAYGDMVRSGVHLSNKILTHIQSRREPPVFAGAVKGSQLHLFGTFINWFITHGHPASGVEPIAVDWNVSKASLIADNEMVSSLLATLNPDRDRDEYFCTFALLRPFHALTDMYRDYAREEEGFWTDKMDKRRHEHMSRPTMDSYWKTVDVIEDDPYVRMCEEADYVLFYVGHVHGDPLPLAPRYEFLESLRFRGDAQAAARVRRNVELLVASLHHVAFTTDMDHNFLTGKRLVKVVPSVIYRAHEYCKALGRQLESELKSMIVAQLHRLGLARRANDSAISLRPEPAHRFADRRARLSGGRRQIERGEEGRQTG
ncbi:hypothetical protein [Nonomuraea zeae]|uniref:Uncharacterized protein n=1 Tax=Nonomuraea zeae TaxID=1642303 RepID=A0A5S4HJP5_9ACTN|nr:hypothetical protein [Nonomuraea zeae]TMR39610.1 hypothetical protein ETD85_00940 [Nonomuraea zeae]